MCFMVWEEGMALATLKDLLGLSIYIYISMIINSFQSIPLYLDMGDLDNKIDLGRVVEYQIFGQHRIMPT